MNLLALDTATEACSVAVYCNGTVLAQTALAGRDHTQLLSPMVHRVMAEAGLAFTQLHGLVCGIGPGSFAGVRIGVSFTKGIALALDVPAVGAGSLVMLAQRAVREHAAERALACIDARMGEVYFAACQRDARGQMQALHAPRVCPPPALAGALQNPDAAPWYALGTGWGSYPVELTQALALPLSASDGSALPQAQDALALALPVFQAGQARDAAELAPLYVRNNVARTLVEQAAGRAAKS